MLNFIISLLLGVLPDVLYYFIYIKQIKDIKTKSILFFTLLMIGFIITNMFYNLYTYLLYDVIIFLIIKKLYKSQANDMFLVIFIELYMILLSIVCFFLIENYIIAFIVYRVLMFVPLLFINKIKSMYKNYTMLWNRHNILNKIKSITLRNISLVVLNVLIVLMYIILVYISKIIK